MKKFTFTCTCGHKFPAEGMDKEDAKKNLMAAMPPDAMKAHWDEKHVGEPMLAMEEMMALVDERLVEDAAEAPAA